MTFDTAQSIPSLIFARWQHASRSWSSGCIDDMCRMDQGIISVSVLCKSTHFSQRYSRKRF